MNGRDFLLTAVALKESQRPSDLRSAVSRAYYGAFHAALDLLEASGVRFSRGGAEIHTKAQHCLANSRVPEVAAVASKLTSLRTDRNEADYDMQSCSMEQLASVNVRIKTAQQVVDMIDGLQSKPEDFASLRILLADAASKLGLHVIA